MNRNERISREQNQMMIRKRLIAVIGAALLLAGCSDFQTQWDQTFASSAPEPKAVATDPDIVSVKLAQAADKASKALGEIANIEQQKNPAVPPVQDDYANAPPNMMQPVSLRWSGPIEQVTRTLAERAGVRFRVKGRRPPVPLVVNVDAYQEPIIHVLRDIGLQAGTRADLSIDQNEGVVEVRYAAADQSR
ncbi:MAG: DotD/TraH family lipoprotein [Alphaproteobacteria bacterium]|nr:DotD/TraH family lipoprotein [Alphaproteobacteria bacterium]